MLNKHFFNIMQNCLYVGSFNPITIAHENIAKDLLKNNIVNKIYFLPVNSLKKDLVSIDNRIKMIKLIKDDKEEILNIYNYSKDGLFNFNILEFINKDKNITHILMGSDLFYKFKTFDNYLNILSKYKLIIIKRDNKLEKYLNKYYQEYKHKFIIINKLYEGSSKIAKDNLNNSNNKYLNKKVLDYIKDNNLYN